MMCKLVWSSVSPPGEEGEFYDVRTRSAFLRLPHPDAVRVLVRG